MYTPTRSTLLLTSALALTLAGCSTGPKNVAPEPQAPMVAAPTPAPAYVIEGVNFDFDESTLQPGGAAILDQVVAGLREHPGVRYEVAGFTDSVGSDAYNEDLSDRRSTTVYDYLVGHGVPASQLIKRGYGESNPVASNETADGRAQNRRVEVRPAQ